MKHFLLLTLAVLTFVGCQKDRINDLEERDLLNTLVDQNQQEQHEAQAALIAELQAEIIALTADIAAANAASENNAVAIADNMNEVDAGFASLEADVEVLEADIAEVKVSVEAVRSNVVVYISETSCYP